jgi:hypothetical protein
MQDGRRARPHERDARAYINKHLETLDVQH